MAGSPGWLGLLGSWVSRVAGSPGWLSLQGGWVSWVAESPGWPGLQGGRVSKVANSLITKLDQMRLGYSFLEIGLWQHKSEQNEESS